MLEDVAQDDDVELPIDDTLGREFGFVEQVAPADSSEALFGEIQAGRIGVGDVQRCSRAAALHEAQKEARAATDVQIIAVAAIFCGEIG